MFALTWFLLLQVLVNVRDESWMLWVATRLARGEILYRDVYDVTTPIAAWLAAGVVRVVGEHLVVLRALTAVVFATEVVVARAVVRRAGLRPLGQAVLVVTLLAFATPVLARVSLYSGLAICVALGVLCATVRWCDAAGVTGTDGDTRGRPAAAWTVGVLGGIAFWTKPNVGVLVALAVGAVLVVSARGRPVRTQLGDVVRIGGGALAVSVVCTVVIVATGAWPAFADQVFASKGAYLQTGFDYLSGLGRRTGDLWTGRTPLAVHRVVDLLVLASPVPLLGAAAGGAFRARGRSPALRTAFVGFALVGLLAVFPRPGLNHVVTSLPLMLTAVVAVWALGNRVAVQPRDRSRRVSLAVGTLAAVTVVAIAVPLVVDRPGPGGSRDLAHFGWTTVTARQRDASAQMGRALRALGVDEVFVVRRDAGFLYLRTGTTDPLPFDYIELSDFGGAGEAGVIRRLAGGDAEWVCLRRPGSGGGPDPALVPRRIERWVRNHFVSVGAITRCDLYRAPDTRG